jgi:hypothetical protein
MYNITEPQCIDILFNTDEILFKSYCQWKHRYILLLGWKLPRARLIIRALWPKRKGTANSWWYIVFDDNGCTCKLLRTGLCSLRTATAQVLILCNHRPVGNAVCIRSPSTSRTCTASTVPGNSSWVDTADIFIPCSSTRTVFAINTSSLT